MTLHRCIGKRKHGGYKNVSHDDILHFSKIAVLIVDEFSMVALPFLHDINARLMAMKDTDHSWGGMSICLNGDIFQVRVGSATAALGLHASTWSNRHTLTSSLCSCRRPAALHSQRRQSRTHADGPPELSKHSSCFSTRFTVL